MAKRASSLFSPTRHHALRRRSVPSGSGSGSSTMSPSSSAPWSRKEAALLVQAWRDVAEHPCAALESVDAFQTRLFLRFQEVCGIGKDNDDDTVSMAGSECSMESVDTPGDAYYARAARTQTSVVLKTYALRRMAGFITDFIAKQEILKQKIADKQARVEVKTSQEGEEVEMTEPDAETEEENTPVDWFALTKNDQIERFQRAGASNYIELDEHMYNTIGTILELQDKCKQEAVMHGSASNGNSSSGSNANAAANAQNSWSAKEVRHVLDAWRDSHLRTPTKLPGGDSFYARFIARSGHNSQRSKPEVADTKIALVNMHQVIATFNNRTPTNGKLTRGNLKRQRQNWFTLSAAEKAKVFAEGGGNQGCRFVDISEDMYETISDLVGPPSSIMLTSSFSSSSSSSSSGGGGGGDVTPEPSKRRSISTKVGTSNASSAHSIKSETIDLISDDDSSSEDDEDDEDDEEKEGNEKESASVEAVPKSSQEHHGDDVDMEEKGNGSRGANATALAETTPADLQSGSADGGDEDLNPDDDAADVDFDDAGSVEHMNCDEELKEPAPAQRAAENDTEQHNEIKDSSTNAELASVEQNGSDEKRTASDVHNSEIEHNIESPRDSARKKQKLEHPKVTAMMNQLERQTQHLNKLVLQVQEERDREREEREKLLRAIKVDQHGREAVLELLRIEQEERRQDREERRNVLQILLRETQQRRKEFGSGGGVKSEDMAVKIKDENARLTRERVEPRPKPRTSTLALNAHDAQHHSSSSNASTATSTTASTTTTASNGRTWTHYQLPCLLHAWRLVVTTTAIQSSPSPAKRIYEQFMALCKCEGISDNEDWSESEVQQMREALVASYQFIKRFNASGGVGGAAGQRVVNWFAISEREQLSIVDERFGKDCEFIFGIDETMYDMIGLILDKEKKLPIEAKEPVESSTPSSSEPPVPSVPSPAVQDYNPAPTVGSSVVLDAQSTTTPPHASSQATPGPAQVLSQPSTAPPSQVLSRIEQLKQQQFEKEIADREANLPSHIWRRGELFRLMRVWKELLDELETLPSEPTPELKGEIYERFCDESKKETEQNGEEPISRSFQVTWSKVMSLVRSYEFIQDFNHDRFHWMTPSVRILKPESWFELSDSYQQWVAKKYFKPRNKRQPVTFAYVYSDMMEVIEVNISKSLAWWAVSEKQQATNVIPAKPSVTTAASTQPRPKVPSPRNVKPTTEKVARPRRTVPSPPTRSGVVPTAKEDIEIPTAQSTKDLSPPPASGKAKRGRKPNWHEDEFLTLLRAWSAAMNEHPVPDEKLGDESFDARVFVKFVAGPGGNAKGRDLAQVRAKLTSLTKSCEFVSDFNADRITSVIKVSSSKAPAAKLKSWFSLSEAKKQKFVSDHFKDRYHGTMFTYVTEEMMPLIVKNAGIELDATAPMRAAPLTPVMVQQWNREELVKLLQAWLDVVMRHQPHEDEGTLLSRIYMQFQAFCNGKSTWPASTVATKKSALMSTFSDLKDYFTQHYMAEKRRAKWFAKSELERWELIDAEMKARDYYEDFDAEMFALMEKIADAENQVALKSSGGRLSRGATSSIKQVWAAGSTEKAARARASLSESSSSKSEFERPSSGRQPADLRQLFRGGDKCNSPSSGRRPGGLRSCIPEDAGFRKRVVRRKFEESRAPGDLFSVRKRQRVDSQASTEPASVHNQQQQQVQLLQSIIDQIREERDLEREERRQERKETKRELEAWRQERLRERESFRTLLREFEKRT